MKGEASRSIQSSRFEVRAVDVGGGQVGVVVTDLTTFK